MFSKGLTAGLLVVSLLLQGLPIHACRCALASASVPAVESKQAAEPICPHCAARTERKAEEEPGASSSRGSEVAFAKPCCGRASACECCLEKSRSRTTVTTQVSAPERPAPQALLPTDPFANLSALSVDGAPLAAVPDVPPARPVRILLGVWRK
jgi:hypothetical protein